MARELNRFAARHASARLRGRFAKPIERIRIDCPATPAYP
jgi:hypothetical protein